MRLKDKVAIITGAGRGIGRGIALRFAQEGAKVVVDDLNAEGGQRTVSDIRRAGGEATFVRADVSDEVAVQRLVRTTTETYGGLHVLVNDAVCSGADITQDNWDANIAVNLKGTWHCCKHAIPAMKAGGGGSIVSISSVNGFLGIKPYHAYNATKAAILNLTRSLAVQHGRDGIRANAICPGTIRTELWEPILQQNPKVWDELVRWYPVGRLGDPMDIANAALFLASQEASFITGAIFVVDGGLSAGLMEFGNFE